MKKLLLIASMMLALTACGSSDSDNGIKISTPRYNGHYTTDFYVLEGACYDITGAGMIIYNSVIYPEFDSSYSVTGNSFADSPFFGVASGPNTDQVHFEGTFDYGGKTIGGEWNSEYCTGYFVGQKVGDLTDREKHHLDAL